MPGLPEGVGCAIAIRVETASPAVTLEEAASVPVRVFIDADGPTRTAFHDALFMRALCTCVESDKQWRKLPALPFAPVGLSKADAMLPTPWRQEDSLRLLAEYFAFPEKFDFFDIDLKAALTGGPPGARQATLHVLLPDLHHTSTPNLLRAFPATALRLGCAPVVNMFALGAKTIRLRKRNKTRHLLVLPCTTDTKATVYSVDAMKLVQGGHDGGTAIDMEWFYEPNHKVQHRWLFELADPALGTGDTVSFVDRGQVPLALGEGSVDVRVTCTNGDLPRSLPIGRVDGDLAGGQATGKRPVRMLRKPTAPLRLADYPEAHWHLIATAHASQRDEAQQHLPGLMRLLRMHARPGSAVTERQLAGILGVSRCIVEQWVKHKVGSSLDRGYEISITIDEAAFAERSIAVFARVMERVFAYYLLSFNFIRLNILGKDGGVLIAGASIFGRQSPA
jgi:type VI secretion system protein ImpG